jgi:hypothetical protein
LSNTKEEQKLLQPQLNSIAESTENLRSMVQRDIDRISTLVTEVGRIQTTANTMGESVACFK